VREEAATVRLDRGVAECDLAAVAATAVFAVPVLDAVLLDVLALWDAVAVACSLAECVFAGPEVP
jgi:hypothetical protein